MTTARTASEAAAESSAPAAGPRAPSPRRDAWRRYFRAERRRMRDAFTRDRLISLLKTLGWVIPLTLLIWVYAEREQVATLEGISIPVDVTTTDATRIITLEEPRDGIIRADIRGPRSSLDRLRRQIAARQDGAAIRIDVDPGLSTGRVHELRVTGMLNNHPDFWNFGITVRNADPPNLQVHVDEIDEREVPVRLFPAVENLTGPPSFDPPAVTVSGPRSVLDRAEERGELALHANLANLDILNVPGQHELASVRLSRPSLLQDRNVRIDPEAVRAVIQVRARDTEFLIRSMPVFPLPPPGLLNNYRLEHEESIANVTVVGPPEQIELLRQPEYAPKPVAVLELRSDDVLRAGEQRSRRVRFLDLPPDVRVTEESTRREVTFRLVERGTAD
jgi:hypothetical protein